MRHESACLKTHDQLKPSDVYFYGILLFFVSSNFIAASFSFLWLYTLYDVEYGQQHAVLENCVISCQVKLLNVHKIDGIICIYNSRQMSIFIPPVNGSDVILMTVSLWQLSKIGKCIRQCLDLTQYVFLQMAYLYIVYAHLHSVNYLYIMAENMSCLSENGSAAFVK